MWQLKKFFFFFFLSFCISAFIFIITDLLSWKMQNKTEKLSEYECGFVPFDIATRQPFKTHFYMVGILFVLFDVEVTLLYPWVFTYWDLTYVSFFVGFLFCWILTIGLIFEWWTNILTIYNYK